MSSIMDKNMDKLKELEFKINLVNNGFKLYHITKRKHTTNTKILGLIPGLYKGLSVIRTDLNKKFVFLTTNIDYIIDTQLDRERFINKEYVIYEIVLNDLDFDKIHIYNPNEFLYPDKIKPNQLKLISYVDYKNIK